MKIADGVEMLELTANTFGRESAFYPSLLWDDQVVVLVDTGYPGTLPALKKAVDRVGTSYDHINRIILTHQDIDHIGNLASIKRELDGQVKILAFREEIPYIDGEKVPHKLAQMKENLDNLPEDRKALYERMKSGFQASFAPVDLPLEDGEVLPFCGGVEVIHAPGHTIGHICLYLQRSKTLIAGDNLRIEEGRLVETPASMNFDMGMYSQSLAKLAKLDIETVISYHSGVFRGPATQQIATLALRG